MKKWQKPIAEVLEATGKSQNPGNCIKMVNWVLQQQGIDIFKIWQNFTNFDVKMNFSISSLIIHKGIEKMAKSYR